MWGIPHSATISELLKAVFSLGSVPKTTIEVFSLGSDPRLYNWEGKARYLQSTESTGFIYIYIYVCVSCSGDHRLDSRSRERWSRDPTSVIAARL
jgi:hypothetical protein